MVKSSLVFLTALAFAKGHVAYWNTPNKLQPVHGLYVKPSVDGTTGDLYVAASEDSGTKSQWLTDQPVGFLPTTPAVHSQALPVAYNPSVALTDDALNPQKRAVVNAPLQYAYAYPTVTSHTEGNAAALPYPYAIQATNSAATNTESVTPRNADTPLAASIPQYAPLQYFYPQMMSAYADLLNAFKETAASAATTSATGEESSTTATPQTASMWPYAYPFQYVMVDPSMWAQNQAAAVLASTPTTTTSATVTDE